MNIRQLNKLIVETIEEDRRNTKRRKEKTIREAKKQHEKRLLESLKRAKLLLEEDQDVPAEVESAEAGSGGAVGSMDPTTDINALSPKALAAAAFGGDGAETLLQAMRDVTKGKKKHWAPKALDGNDVKDVASMAAKAKEVFGDAGTLEKRIANVNKALGASKGFPKPEMPAFEENDFAAIKDALDSTDGGELAVDFADEYKGGTTNVQQYHAQETGQLVGDADLDAGQPTDNLAAERQDEALSRWNKLAGLDRLTEIASDDRFPFAGAGKVMQGASNRGASKSSDFDLGSTSGLAKTFLTKGAGTGDQTSVSDKTGFSNAEMKPTQTNIKAAKSLLFAFINAGLDMEGAFADQTGNILDGHHRWSGQHLRTGGAAQHTGVHVITRPEGMDVPTFLTMLTSIGQALGRPTKLS